jgi:hypothetical protein
MTRIRLILVLVLLAGACSAGPGQLATSETYPPTTSAPAQTEVTRITLPPSSGAVIEASVNPLTVRPIPLDTLALMPLPTLQTPFNGFAVTESVEETNERAIDRLPDGRDEAEDVNRFGRQTGYRTVLKPTWSNGADTVSVDTWVATFTSPQGASDYLRDYAGDVLKDRDAGHAADLRINEARLFDVEEVGEEAIGLIMEESVPTDDDDYQETIVGFRIGRILAFVSVLRNRPADNRIVVLGVAADLEDRIISALDGSLEAPVVDTPAELVSYRFDYEQSLTQRFTEAIEQIPDDEDDEGAEPEPPPEGEEPPPEGEEPPPEGEEPPPEGEAPPEEGDETTTTTEPPREYVTRTVTTKVTATGVVNGDAMECTVSYNTSGSRTGNKYVVIDDDAWVLKGSTYTEIERYTEPYAADLLYCPGWSPSRSESGVRPSTRPGRGVVEETADGEQIERFDLSASDLVSIGLGGADAGGIRVDRFHVWTGGDGPWVVRVDLQMRGSSSAMERALGAGFRAGGSVTIGLGFRATDFNDPTIRVTPPS